MIVLWLSWVKLKRVLWTAWLQLLVDESVESWMIFFRVVDLMAFLTNLLTLLIDICRHLLNWLLLTFHYRLLRVTILNRRYRRGYFCGQDWLVLWVFWFLTSIASFAVIIGWLSYLLKQICDELVSRCLRETCRNLTVLWSKLFNLLIGWLSYLLCRLIRLFFSLVFELIGLRLIWGSS